MPSKEYKFVAGSIRRPNGDYKPSHGSTFDEEAAPGEPGLMETMVESIRGLANYSCKPSRLNTTRHEPAKVWEHLRPIVPDDWTQGLSDRVELNKFFLCILRFLVEAIIEDELEMPEPLALLQRVDPSDTQWLVTDLWLQDIRASRLGAARARINEHQHLEEFDKQLMTLATRVCEAVVSNGKPTTDDKKLAIQVMIQVLVLPQAFSQVKPFLFGRCSRQEKLFRIRDKLALANTAYSDAFDDLVQYEHTFKALSIAEHIIKEGFDDQLDQPGLTRLANQVWGLMEAGWDIPSARKRGPGFVGKIDLAFADIVRSICYDKDERVRSNVIQECRSRLLYASRLEKDLLDFIENKERVDWHVLGNRPRLLNAIVLYLLASHLASQGLPSHDAIHRLRTHMNSLGMWDKPSALLINEIGEQQEVKTLCSLVAAAMKANHQLRMDDFADGIEMACKKINAGQGKAWSVNVSRIHRFGKSNADDSDPIGAIGLLG